MEVDSDRYATLPLRFSRLVYQRLRSWRLGVSHHSALTPAATDWIKVHARWMCSNSVWVWPTQNRKVYRPAKTA